MIEATLDIATTDGAMQTFLCHPERGGPFPAVMPTLLSVADAVIE
jgi:carboxymethylenebutenolidase